MAKKSDKELEEYLINIMAYSREIVEAAINESKNRGRIFSEVELSTFETKIQERENTIGKNTITVRDSIEKNNVDDKSALALYSRKIEIICYTILGLVIMGFVIAYWGFPDFIGENEMDLLDIVPMNYAFYLGILICGTLVFLRLKYKIDIFGSRTKNPDIKFFASIIIYPMLSIGLGFLTLFDIYSFSNYCFKTEKQALEGEIYKMDITEVSKGPDKFYVCFNEKMKYRLRVSEDNYSKYKEGDKINVKVYKGRFWGYYLIDKYEFRY